MKKIFNHIKENWIKYSFEILVITVGILAAVGMDNLNENRKNRHTEQKMLKDLANGLLGDLNTFQYNIDIHEQAQNSCEIILNVMEDNGEFADSLASYFAATHYYTVSFSKRGAYESLKSMGFEIIDLYEQWYRILQVNQEILREDIQNVKRTFNHDHFNQFHIFDATEPESFYGGKMTPIDFQNLKLNHQYKYNLKSLHSGHSAFLFLLYYSVDQVDDIIDQLNHEINRLTN